ncbi:MAG: hypothetical protein ABSG84_10780 [Acidobacteriaceae bacterium]|jgi:hypothetical protein
MNLCRSIPSAIFPVLLLLVACSHRTPEATVEVIDTSLSITPRAEQAALNAVQNQIAHMQRGDVLVLIPISGDAANDTGGRILRLSAPTRRETYDTDLHRFQVQARKQYAAWVKSLDQHQSRTDILGALDVAQQEIARLPKESDPKLIVVSDFFEDDGTYRFVSASELATPERARRLAATLREEHGFAMQDVPLCLGRLESSDFARLPEARKKAVEAFWAAYFATGDRPAEVQFDGTGMLAGADQGCSGGKR